MLDHCQIVRASKFLSLILRHRPEKIGLTLDAQGWASVDELLERLAQRNFPLDRAGLKQVVAENDKQRFAFNPDRKRIRASQGHSLPVDLGLPPSTPPDALYHGTATRYRESILREGLLPGNRQHVHLSKDIPTALAVGRRHGRPLVFEVAAARMHADGLLFYLSDNGVWLAAAVPPQYLTLVQEETRS